MKDGVGVFIAAATPFLVDKTSNAVLGHLLVELHDVDKQDLLAAIYVACTGDHENLYPPMDHLASWLKANRDATLEHGPAYAVIRNQWVLYIRGLAEKIKNMIESDANLRKSARKIIGRTA